MQEERDMPKSPDVIMQASEKATKLAVSVYGPCHQELSYVDLLHAAERALAWTLYIHKHAYQASFNAVKEAVSPMLIDLAGRKAIGTISTEEERSTLHEILGVADAYGISLAVMEPQQITFDVLNDRASIVRQQIGRAMEHPSLPAVLTYFNTVYWGYTLHPEIALPGSVIPCVDLLIRLLCNTTMEPLRSPHVLLTDEELDELRAISPTARSMVQLYRYLQKADEQDFTWEDPAEGDNDGEEDIKQTRNYKVIRFARNVAALLEKS
ncbi:hypothetical protein ACI5L6_003038 [Salmonella enterica subsp. enterica serovar Anatum]